MSIKEIAYKKRIVKDLKDVTKEYSLSKEETSYYPSCDTEINHLFAIIESNYAVSMEYFFFLISSQLQKLSYKENLYLPKYDKNNLIKNSIVKTNIIY